MRVSRSISFDTEDDKELIEWLGEQGNVSATVRKALYLHMKREKSMLTLQDQLQRIESKIDRISNLEFKPVESDNSKKVKSDIPPDILNNIVKAGL